jgi:MoaE-MoaD fusion protein
MWQTGYDERVRVNVLFFGVLREITGLRSDQVEVTAGATIESVFALYADRFETLKSSRPSILFARNQEFSIPGALLEDNDEVAFLPPVSGGCGLNEGSRFLNEIRDPAGHLFALTRSEIDSQPLARELQRPEDGAVATFEGIVRNNTKGRATRYLEYECYEAMALRQMAAIGREIAATAAIGRLAIVHRLGRLEVGEASVVVIATAPHRKAAFDAALEGINRLKQEVPIWKKEFFEDGEVWVDGEWDEHLLSSQQ